MEPVVGEVVLVGEPLADPQAEIAEPDLARVKPAVVAVLSSVDDKPVQMTAAPPERDLQRRVEIRDAVLRADLQPPPDQRADPRAARSAAGRRSVRLPRLTRARAIASLMDGRGLRSPR